MLLDQDSDQGGVGFSVTGTLSVCLVPATFHFNLYKPSVSVLSAQNWDMYSAPVDQMICWPTTGAHCQYLCVMPVLALGSVVVSSLHFVKPIMVAPAGAVSLEYLKPHSWYASVLVTM